MRALRTNPDLVTRGLSTHARTAPVTVVRATRPFGPTGALASASPVATPLTRVWLSKEAEQTTAGRPTVIADPTEVRANTGTLRSHTLLELRATTTAASAAIATTLLAAAVRLAYALVIHARILTKAASAAPTTAIAAALLTAAVRLANTLAAHARILTAASTTTAAAAVITALLSTTVRLADTLVIHAGVKARAAATAATTAITAAIFATTIWLTHTLAVDTGVLAGAAATALTATIISALLTRARGEYVWVLWLTVECIKDTIVIIVFVKAVREASPVRIREALVDGPITVVVLTVTKLTVVIGHLVANQLTLQAERGALDAEVRVVSVTLGIKRRFIQPVGRRCVAVVILTVTDLEVFIVGVIT